MTRDKKALGIKRPKLIVMPFQNAQGKPFDGIGLGIHFLFGNLFAVHDGLMECWFGWRVKKIFPEPGLLEAYCRSNISFPDILKLAEREKVRYWLEGKYRRESENIFLDLVLHDTIADATKPDDKKRVVDSRIELPMVLNDGLIEARKIFFDWLETWEHPFINIEKAMWPEKITVTGLDFLGRGLEAIYLNYIQDGGGDNGLPDRDLIDLSWFDKAVDASKESYLVHDLRGWALYKNGENESAKKAFETALTLNPDGLGALSGMMWCALSMKNRERAVYYSLAKAGCRGEDLEKARAFVDKKFENLS
jgi:tetratricopeptide (TPR) repeat protein